MNIAISLLTKIKNEIHNNNIKLFDKLFSRIIHILQRNNFTKTYIILIIKNITKFLNKTLVKNFSFLAEKSNLFNLVLINN